MIKLKKMSIMLWKGLKRLEVGWLGNTGQDFHYEKIKFPKHYLVKSRSSRLKQEFRAELPG